MLQEQDLIAASNTKLAPYLVMQVLSLIQNAIIKGIHNQETLAEYYPLPSLSTQILRSIFFF